jgi:hypothetical protein
VPYSGESNWHGSAGIKGGTLGYAFRPDAASCRGTAMGTQPATLGGPEPGRPLSLGPDVDRADAADLLAVLRTVRLHGDRSKTNAYKVAREALWFMWEQRRLPRPLIRSKYPASYPWSPAARELLAKHRSEGRADTAFGGVVIEHLIPATLMVQEALAAALDLDVDGMLQLLKKHGAASVVSVEDDKRLSAAGLRSRMPENWNGDVWARPRAAGLDPIDFAPVAARNPKPRIDRAAKPTMDRNMGRGRDGRRDHTWDSYVVEAGHDPAKIAMARSLVELIERSTGWPSERTKNQIIFRKDGKKVLAVQLWTRGVRLEACSPPTQPAPDLFSSTEARMTKAGACYWIFDDPSNLPTDIDRLLALLAASH